MPIERSTRAAARLISAASWSIVPNFVCGGAGAGQPFHSHVEDGTGFIFHVPREESAGTSTFRRQERIVVGMPARRLPCPV